MSWSLMPRMPRLWLPLSFLSNGVILSVEMAGDGGIGRTALRMGCSLGRMALVMAVRLEEMAAVDVTMLSKLGMAVSVMMMLSPETCMGWPMGEEDAV